MSAGKVTLLVFGIIVLLLSFGVLAGGGTLLWANARYVDKEGFLTSDTLHIKKDSFAVVAGPIELDEVALKVLQTIGVITSFEFEGKNNNPSKPIFMGVIDQAQLGNYLGNVAYDEIKGFDFGRLNTTAIRYINHPGYALPSHPASDSRWAVSSVGSGAETLKWETQIGNYSVVMMNEDGSRHIDFDVIVKAKIPSIVGYGAGLLAGGIILLIIGGLMVFLAMRQGQSESAS